MTYFAFLAIFLGIPIAIFSLITIIDFRRNKWMPSALHAYQPWVVMLGLAIIAFVYTTPWDNYLVATSVWWYDIDLVSGIVLGWVPIEEYTFFLVQPVFTGLWLILLMRYMPINPVKADSNRIRIIATSVVGVIWIASVIALILTFVDPFYKPLTYLGLELSWALIPVLIQVSFGADILWRHRRIVFVTIATSTLYLAGADAIAISSGTWTIDPAQSLPIFIGVLPIEEFIFFLLTNILIVFGITLVLAEESQARAHSLARYRIMRPLIQLLPNYKAEMAS